MAGPSATFSPYIVQGLVTEYHRTFLSAKTPLPWRYEKDPRIHYDAIADIARVAKHQLFEALKGVPLALEGRFSVADFEGDSAFPPIQVGNFETGEWHTIRAIIRRKGVAKHDVYVSTGSGIVGLADDCDIVQGLRCKYECERVTQIESCLREERARRKATSMGLRALTRRKRLFREKRAALGESVPQPRFELRHSAAWDDMIFAPAALFEPEQPQPALDSTAFWSEEEKCAEKEARRLANFPNRSRDYVHRVAPLTCWRSFARRGPRTFPTTSLKNAAAAYYDFMASELRTSAAIVNTQIMTRLMRFKVKAVSCVADAHSYHPRELKSVWPWRLAPAAAQFAIDFGSTRAKNGVDLEDLTIKRFTAGAGSMTIASGFVKFVSKEMTRFDLATDKAAIAQTEDLDRLLHPVPEELQAQGLSTDYYLYRSWQTREILRAGRPLPRPRTRSVAPQQTVRDVSLSVLAKKRNDLRAAAVARTPRFRAASSTSRHKDKT